MGHDGACSAADHLQFLKTNWLTSIGQLTYDAPAFSEADIEDALAYQQEHAQPQEDDMMLDGIPEEDEMDAMVASYEEQQANASQRPPSPTLSDEDYDDIFAELISQEELQPQEQMATDQMDMTDDGNINVLY